MKADFALSDKPRIKLGSSRHPDPETAVCELALSLDQPEIGLIIVFFSSNYDLNKLAAELKLQFGSTKIIGCTTAGEIGPLGYLEGTISGVSIHRDDLVCEIAILDHLADTNFQRAQDFAYDLKESLHQKVPNLDPSNSFALMLIDGLCAKEEIITRAFYNGLGGIALVGGSAGDNLLFKETKVLCNGRFISNAAVILIATTPFLFEVFKTQHFITSNEQLVVTGAIAKSRIVTEINGCPAAEEYARAIGVNVEDLNSNVFASFPVVVRIGNADFVRSIQKINSDGSLVFYCAIDEGIVFRLAKGVDMIDNLATALETVMKLIGPPALLLGHDCILRHVEAKERGMRERIGTLLSANNTIGFSTYGEQFRGMHINQTFTGVAIGNGRRK